MTESAMPVGESADELALNVARELLSDAADTALRMDRPELLFMPAVVEKAALLQDRWPQALSAILVGLPYEWKSELLRLTKRHVLVAKASEGRPADDELGAVDADQFLSSFEPPAFVIEPVLTGGHVTGLTALPNGGKTSIAAQFLLMVSAGVVLKGLEAEPGRVLYLAGDSDTSFAVQLIAACEQHGIDPDELADRVVVVPKRFPLTLRLEAIRELAEARGGFALVVVDTRPAYSAADAEDDNLQALADALALRELTRISGRPAVLALCHPTKNAGRDQLFPRGGSAFLAEIDNNLTLWNDDGVIELSANKRRMPEFDPIRWKFEVVDIDRTDAKGRPVRSVVAVRVTEDTTEQRQQVRRQDEDRLLYAMLRHPNESIRGWAQACGWVLQNDQRGPHVSKVDRILKQLISDKLVEKFRHGYRLTARGKAEAERVS